MVGLTGFQKAISRWFIIFSISLSALTAGAQGPLKIMPLGNSITRGSMCVNGNIYTCVLNPDSSAIGYRYRLYNLLMAAGYDFDFVGAHRYGYSVFDDPDNSGFDGIRSWDLADVIETGTSSFTGQVTPGPYFDSYPADIILLHIGTNDVLSGQTSVANVSRILDAIDTYENVSGHPVLVFLATILSEKDYPCNTHPGTITFNSNLVSMAQARIQNGDHIVLVDMECGAGMDYYNDLVDQVHPDLNGYSKMGDMWFQAINNFNSAPLILQVPEQVTPRGTPFDTLNLDNYVTDVENTPDQMSWTISPSDPQHFILNINSKRQVIISPKDTAWSGSETVQFTVTDQGKVLTALKKSATTSVTFTVDWMPQIIGQAVTLSTPEETPLVLDTTMVEIIEPDKAPTGQGLLVQGGDNYSVNGTTITPATDFNGTLIVPVRLSVDGKVSNTYNLEVEVTPVNDPPQFVSQVEITTDRNVPVQLTLYDITYTDPDNSPGEHTLFLLPGINYTVAGDSVIPRLNIYGDLPVNAGLSDLQDTTYFTLNVTVNYRNIPPEFTSVPDTTAIEDSPYTYVVTAYDVDVEDPNVDQSITFWADTIPSWISMNLSNDVLAGVPANEDVGKYEVRIGITDGIDSVYQDFELTVVNVNDPPVISGQKDSISGIVNSYAVLSVDELIIEDPDNTPAEMSLVILPGDYYSSDGDTVFFARDYTGMLDVNLLVNDGEDDSNVFDTKISVHFGDNVPVLSSNLLSKVYPNPAHNYVNFELNNTEPVFMEIMDMTGKSLFTSPKLAPGETIHINLSGYSRGIYLFRIYNDSKFQVGKLVVE